jgi:ubiquinone/menaquinone biosynthesis C-methylase UbiE
MSAWDRVAPFYDLQLWLERGALDSAIELAEIGASDRLLDLGTGTGALLRRLKRSAAAPREAVGIDVSHRMLARAPTLPAGWELHRAEAERLPFADRSFDVVTAAYLLHLLDAPQRAAVLVEARRVIRPEGCLVTVTVAPPRSRALARGLSRIFRPTWSRGVLAGLRPLDPQPDLEAAGFLVQESRRSLTGYPSLIVRARPVNRLRQAGVGRETTSAREEPS